MASLLTTRTPPEVSLGLPSAGGGAGGNISLALVTEMEDGISMGRISWMMGMKEAIVPPVRVRCVAELDEDRVSPCRAQQE